MRGPNDKFTMSEPKPFKGLGAKYAFWLTTSEKSLVEFVKTINCVAFVSSAGNPPLSRTTVSKSDNTAQPLRVLVAVNDDFDADEAWHWIYQELDDEARFVQLDSIWEDAINGVL